MVNLKYDNYSKFRPCKISKNTEEKSIVYYRSKKKNDGTCKVDNVD